MQQVTALQAVKMYGVSTDETKHTLIAYCRGRADSNSPVRLPCPLSSHTKDIMSLMHLSAAHSSTAYCRQAVPSRSACYLLAAVQLNILCNIDIKCCDSKGMINLWYKVETVSS